MIEKLALRIAHYIKKIEPEKTASIDVMKFSLEALLNVFFTLLFILVIGTISGKTLETFLGFVSFAFLRFFSGGIHLRNAVQCSIVSTILISIAPHIPLSHSGERIITILSLALILVFAPSNIEGYARIPKKYFPILKLISFIIVLSGLFIDFPTFTIICFIQAIAIVPLSKFRLKEVSS